VTEGLAADGVMLVNAERPPSRVGGKRVICIPASRMAAQRGSKFANLIMVGALAAAVGEPPLDDVADAAADLLGKKVPPEDVRGAVTEGYRCLS
jgi:Pyruvate/2-oxoacid:ferredoxin oxidoreductase gamma subunit